MIVPYLLILKKQKPIINLVLNQFCPDLSSPYRGLKRKFIINITPFLPPYCPFYICSLTRPYLIPIKKEK